MFDFEQQSEPDQSKHALTPERLGALVESINSSHIWFHEKRDPLNIGVMAEFHPWMGSDNAPCYDRPMARIASEATPEELTLIKAQRRDLIALQKAGGDISERPKDSDYAAYLKIAHKLARVTRKEMNGEDVAIDDIPFVVYSPMLTGMLIKAERDLAVLADAAGKDDIA